MVRPHPNRKYRNHSVLSPDLRTSLRERSKSTKLHRSATYHGKSTSKIKLKSYTSVKDDIAFKETTDEMDNHFGIEIVQTDDGQVIISNVIKSDVSCPICLDDIEFKDSIKLPCEHML